MWPSDKNVWKPLLYIIGPQAYEAGGGGAAAPRIENFQGKFCFQGKRKLLKIPE